MKHFKFAVLDPRGTPEAAAKNEAVFNGGPVFGIEVTIPELAKRCIGNLDPQHSGGDSEMAAIEVAMSKLVDVCTIATVKPDLDSIGAMALIDRNNLEYWLYGTGQISPYPLEQRKRIEKIASADKFSRGEWKVKNLPTRDNPWDDESASADSSRDLAAINAAVSDQTISLEKRVCLMDRWLRTGEEPVIYRNQVESERLDMISALESGEIKISTVAGLTIAVVVSSHRAALQLGYCKAPIVVALNPSFKLGQGEAHRKFTVCQYRLGYIDIKSVINDLSQLENGWGGSPTIIGSPQGIGSKLTIEQVVKIVEKNLL